MDKEHRLVRLGIIGGMGPETSAQFCGNVARKFRRETGALPDIILQNVPLSAAAEEEFIKGNRSPEHFSLLLQAVRIFNQALVDAIVIPCNTAHVFIDDLRKRSRQPIISIMEETAAEVQRRGLHSVGILATTKTIQQELFQKHLGEIKIILPQEKQQQFLDELILRIVQGIPQPTDSAALWDMINQLERQGVEAVILGCTDLSLSLQPDDSPLPLIDTCSVLEDASVQFLLGGTV